MSTPALEPNEVIPTTEPADASRTILHVLAPAPYGGLESVVRDLSIAQAGAGHRVHVAAVVEPAAGSAGALSAAADRGVALHAVSVSGRAYVREHRLMTALLDRIRPDVVHTHGYRTDVIDGHAARTRGLSTVTTVHGFTRDGWRNRAYEWVQRRALRRFDAVVAVSRAQVAELTGSGVDAARVHCIPNTWSPGVEPLSREAARRELGLSDDAFVIGWVGRLSHEKGPDVLVRACRDTGLEGVTLSVIGDGPLRASLEADASALAVDARWHGARPDAARLFRAFDVFVLSSRTEGTPIVLFEAMAAGVPIVAAAVGGVPDVVADGEAVRVAAEDVAALARAVRGVRADPETARVRAAAALRRLAEHSDVRSWLDRYDMVYRAVQRNGRRNRS